MLYKSKHLSKLVPLTAVAVFTLAGTSCQNKDKDNASADNIEQGLLAEKIPDINDKYGSVVSLQQVNIPIYNAQGKRLKDRSILTRGQDATLFATYDYGETSLQRAYFNDSPEAVYIMAGAHREVIDEKGCFVGLVINDRGQVIAIAPQNMQSYISEYGKVLSEGYRGGRYSSKLVENKKDTLHQKLLEENVDTLVNDSVDIDSTKHTNAIFTARQFMDSIAGNTHK